MNWLHRQVTARPHALAVQTTEQSLTWSALGTRVRRVAAALRGVGVQQNDRVAVLIEDNLQFAVTILAVGWLGATLIPLNRRLTDVELSWILQDIEPHLLVIDHTAGVRNIELADKPFVQVNELTLSLDCEPVEVDEHGVAVIMYTSGTTGPPKPVPLTWENIKASAAASAFNIGVHRDDMWLCVIPLYHIGGLSILYRGVLYGTATLILDRFDPAEVIAMLPQVTIMSLVPTMLHRLIQAGMEKHITDGRVRAVLLGGGPADLDAIVWCTSRGLPVLHTYGMTEASSQVTTMPIDAVTDLPIESPRWASAGLPVLGAAISVRSVSSQTLPAHALGNIFVRGPMVTNGYLDRPTENSRRFVDGWFDTGDFGYVDEQGYLFVKARRDDLIVSGGENVYPAEVEAVLNAHPTVVEAAVFGLPDKEWGQVVCAAVVLSSHCEVEVLDTWCRRSLAGFKVPRRIWVVEALPRTASGKIQHPVLRDSFGQRFNEG